MKSNREIEIQLNVNGRNYTRRVPSQLMLIQLLRDDLGLTGTKYGCGTGSCGACTVLMDGKPVNSCLVLAVETNGSKILTIEGLAAGAKLHPLQQAFIDEGAVQCGFCSPGFLMTARGLLDENPHPTEAEIRKAIAGNMCRCTGYDRIVKAIQKVADR